MRDLSQGSSKFLDVGVLDSKAVLRINYKLFLMYFGTKKIAGVDFGFGELGKEFKEAKDLSDLFSVLGATKMLFKSPEKVMKARFLWK